MWTLPHRMVAQQSWTRLVRAPRSLGSLFWAGSWAQQSGSRY